MNGARNTTPVPGGGVMAGRKRKIWLWMVIPLLIACGFPFLSARQTPARTVSLIADPACGAASRHGLDRLKAAFRQKRFVVDEARSAESAAGSILVVAGFASAGSPAARLLQDAKAALPAGPEALSVLRTTWKGKDLVVLCGADDTGLMYAALDTADRIGWSAGPADVLGRIKSVAEKPDLVDRAVSIYTMQRAYFESRLFDDAYWDAYFDMLARSRFNSFVVIFGYENGGFMAPPYPYFFDVDGFPGVRLVGHTAEAADPEHGGLPKTDPERPRPRDPIHGRHLGPHLPRRRPGRGNGRASRRPPPLPVPGLVWGSTRTTCRPTAGRRSSEFVLTFPEMDALPVPHAQRIRV